MTLETIFNFESVCKELNKINKVLYGVEPYKTQDSGGSSSDEDFIEKETSSIASATISLSRGEDKNK